MLVVLCWCLNALNDDSMSRWRSQKVETRPLARWLITATAVASNFRKLLWHSAIAFKVLGETFGKMEKDIAEGGW